MSNYRVTFKMLKVGDRFTFGGKVFRKINETQAVGAKSLTHAFGLNESCRVSKILFEIRSTEWEAMTPFQKFQATRTHHENMQAIAEKMRFDTDDTRPVFAYTADCYIYINDDGTYHLHIGRSEWVSPNLRELEARLYWWAVCEFPEEFPGMFTSHHGFICDLSVTIGDDAFIAAFLSGDWSAHTVAIESARADFGVDDYMGLLTA